MSQFQFDNFDEQLSEVLNQDNFDIQCKQEFQEEKLEESAKVQNNLILHFIVKIFMMQWLQSMTEEKISLCKTKIDSEFEEYENSLPFTCEEIVKTLGVNFLVKFDNSLVETDWEKVKLSPLSYPKVLLSKKKSLNTLLRYQYTILNAFQQGYDLIKAFKGQEKVTSLSSYQKKDKKIQKQRFLRKKSKKQIENNGKFFKKDLINQDWQEIRCLTKSYILNHM